MTARTRGRTRRRTDESYYVASQWQMMWWKFRRHRLAVVAGPLLAAIYLVALLADFVAPYGVSTRFPDYLSAPPNRIRLLGAVGGGDDAAGGAFVYGLRVERHPHTLRKIYEPDRERRYAVRFFGQGEEYRFWGTFKTRIHLFVPDEEGAPLFLFGTDRLGRDLFSRVLYAARISLSIGLVGVLISTVLGVLLGGVAGYFGGVVDRVVMRLVDLLASIPTIPLWMGLAAAVPRQWSVLTTYFAITLILSLVGWTHLARVVRGRFLSLREEDFVMAAVVAAASERAIIFGHLLPSFFSYVIVSLTLAVPGMILGETALSFLGLGIQPPAVSWGTLLQDAQNFQAVSRQPWLLIPCLFVVLTVLLYNFLGDGLRDAADPYS